MTGPRFYGIRRDTLPVTNVYSGSVLRMEISSPEQELLIVIDVPGTFKNVTWDLTTKNDRTLVREIVLGYVADSRSVMLPVIPANVDAAT